MLLILLCALFCGCGGTTGGEPMNIVGTWQVKPDKPSDGAGFTYEFTATEMTIKDRGKFVMSGTYKIDESKRPRIITYSMTKGAGDSTPVERQISQFGDELSIGSGDTLVKLKRVTK